MATSATRQPCPTTAKVPTQQHCLRLRVGELVQVRNAAEILSTLDETGKLEELPFMPEMLQYCGHRFRVYKRADKSCDTIIRDGIRRMYNTVHLELRCDGSAHGGCQAACLLFWKEAWLTRVADLVRIEESPQSCESPSYAEAPELLSRNAISADPANITEMRYYCQATELRKATSPLPWWEFSQYARDIWSGNVGVGAVLRAAAVGLFNRIQRWRGGTQYPLHFRVKFPRLLPGTRPQPPKPTKTPLEYLNLEPGELVQVKSWEEIRPTLNDNDRNRGLSFDREMLKYCGGTYRVLRRVDRLIDEKTGKMLDMKLPCIVLDGVVCCGDYNRFCPRAIYPYWREIWLRRVNA